MACPRSSLRAIPWRAAGTVARWLWTAWLIGLAAQGADSAPAPSLGRKEFLAGLMAKVPPYVRWPEAAFDGLSDPFRIGLLGGDPTEGLLAEVLRGTRIEGREVEVKTFATAAEVSRCQMLYVPAAKAAEWEAASKTAPPHLLVLGEDEAVEKSGGVMSASPQDRKLHVFLANARKAQLDVDARLLRIAKVHR